MVPPSRNSCGDDGEERFRLAAFEMLELPGLGEVPVIAFAGVPGGGPGEPAFIAKICHPLPGAGVARRFQASDNGCRTLHMFSQDLKSGLSPGEQLGTVGFGLLRQSVRNSME
jgi:hypothetical protein